MPVLPVDLLLEGMLAVLLGVTVFYCVLLDRRLRQLRSGQDGLRDLISGLDMATKRAQASIFDLKAASETASTDLSGMIARARSLGDELSLMIESGNNLADRLEGGRTAKTSPAPSFAGPDRPVAAEPSALSLQKGLDRETEDVNALQNRLLKALREAR